MRWVSSVRPFTKNEIWNAAFVVRRYNGAVKWLRIVLVVVALCVAAAGGYLWFITSQSRKFEPQINAAAKRYNVDPFLIKAVIWRETRFHPDRRGRAGEIGLMQ